MQNLEYHPVANLFPMMSEEAYKRLKADIEQHGQREDIIVWRNQLVDGRNRLRACNELGIEPQVAELLDETDPLAYAISQNLHRRHLSTTQRSLVAAKLATLKRGRPSGENPSKEGFSSESEAASLLSVSLSSIQRAKHVIEHGAEKLIAAVESGAIPVALAEKLIKTGCNKKEQAKLAADGAKAMRDFISPPSQKKAALPQAESVAANMTDITVEAAVENKQAIKTLLSAKNKLVVIDAALRSMSQEDITALMLRCEELLEGKP